MPTSPPTPAKATKGHLRAEIGVGINHKPDKCHLNPQNTPYTEISAFNIP
jgi:hypothetical protein